MRAAAPVVLVISPEPPYPLTGGGALRTASLLQFLAQRANATIDLVLFAVEGASDPAGSLPPGLIRDVLKLPLPAHSKAMPARIVRNSLRLVRGVPPLLDRFSGQQDKLAAWLKGRTQQYDLCLIEHFWCAPYLDTVRPHAARVVLDLHNIESEWHQRLSAQGNALWRLGHRRFADFYRAQEQHFLPNFAAVLTTSPREAEAIPCSRTMVYRNAIPQAPVQNEANSDRPPSVAFSGNLEYTPNQQAIAWFAQTIWPLLRQRHPDLEWRIIGKNPHAIRETIAGLTNVHCTGPVPDAIPVLAQSQIAIVPVLTGSGTRVKILEAWAARLPVVATTLGAEGLDAVPGQHLVLADSPAGFAASISELLAAPDQRARIGDAGRRLYEENYTWDAAWDKLSKMILPFDERLY